MWSFLIDMMFLWSQCGLFKLILAQPDCRERDAIYSSFVLKQINSLNIGARNFHVEVLI